MMISPNLPAELKAALDGKLQGFSRTDAARRSSQISTTYRAGGSSGTIKSDADALAYALARMPATYAAVAASLNALTEIAPDLAPETLLDVGAGPGTASWAAAEAFSSLQDFTLLDANGALSRLALELARDSSRLAQCRYLPGDAGANLAEVSQADLVVASYVIGELREGDQHKLAETMWAKARHALVVIEPGTPAGYARILALRQQLDHGGRLCRRALPPRKALSAHGAGLVPFLPAPAALSGAPPDQGRRRAVRGRTLHLRGADPYAARCTRRARAGAAGCRQGRDHGQALHRAEG
ncbi:ribosomal protein RSM22 (predicted rRNA methylase) [Bradyrhizobium sp. LB13.1]